MKALLCSALAIVLAPSALAQVAEPAPPENDQLIEDSSSQIDRLRGIAERAEKAPETRAQLSELILQLSDVNSPTSKKVSELRQLGDTIQVDPSEFDRLLERLQEATRQD